MPFECDDVPVLIRPDGSYLLTAPLIYQGGHETFIVPPLLTDLATIPLPLRALFPVAGRGSRAAILHDWLCTELHRAHLEGKAPPATSVEADGLFRRTLRELGYGVILRWLFWTGVRWGAVGSPSRRRGWVRTAPAVVAISLAAAPVVVPVATITTVALLLYVIVEKLAGMVVRA